MKRFFKFTLPSVFSMWVYALYTMVDGFFVANYVGETEFAAVNISMPVVTTFFAIGILLSIGTQAKVGHSLGAGDLKRANQIFSTAFLSLIIIGLSYMAIIYIFMEKIIYTIGANEETYIYVKDYLSTVLPFALFFMTTYQFEVMVKLDGFPMITAFSVFVAAVSNIVLDYLFIVKFDMGVYGAGLATGLAQLVSSGMMFSHFFNRKGRLKFVKSYDFKILKKIIPLGIGDAISEVAIGYTVFLFNRAILRRVGPEGLIIYAAISYVSIFAQVAMTGVAQGLAPLFAVDYGRKDYKKILKSLSGGFAFVFAIALAFKLIIIFFGDSLVNLFLEEGTKLTQKTSQALSVYSYSYFFTGLNVIMITVFASLGRSKYAIWMSLLRTPISITILMLIYENFIGGPFIWSVLTCAEALTAIVSLYFIRHEIIRPLKVAQKKQIKKNV